MTKAQIRKDKHEKEMAKLHKKVKIPKDVKKELEKKPKKDGTGREKAMEWARKQNKTKILREGEWEDGRHVVRAKIRIEDPRGKVTYRVVDLVHSDPFEAHKDVATLSKEDWE